MLAQRNATLTMVYGPLASTGTVDDWDAADETPPAEGIGPARWTGDVPAYYHEASVRGTSGAGAELTFTRTLIVETDQARALAIRAGDLVGFTDAAGADVLAVVQGTSVADLPGIPSAVRTTRLELASS